MMTLFNKKTFFSITGLVILVILLLVINLFSSLVFKSARLDLTEEKLYTLSQGTHNILNQFDEPVTIRFFYSRKIFNAMPNIANYAQRVKELLEEYQSIAADKFKLIVIDPEPFSEYEDQAVQFGLQGVPVDDVGTVAYFGLVGTNSIDSQEVIPFFQAEKEDSLEYDISKLVHKLIYPKQQVVGLMTALPMIQAENNPFANQQPNAPKDWVILNQIRQQFDLRSLEIDIKKVPSDINLLLLVHPKTLSDETLYAVDQFVLGGGRLIVFVDPFSESDIPDSDPQNPMAAFSAPRSSTLTKLFDAWGVELVSNKIVLDRKSATRVNASVNGRPQAIDYVAWLNLTDTNFNSNDFITKDLKNVTMATAGHFKSEEKDGINFTPLLSASNQSMEARDDLVKFGPNPAALLRDYVPGGEPLVLAARVSGVVPSSFSEPPGEDKEGQHLKVSKEAVNLIVVADTDLLADRFWVDTRSFFGRTVAIPRSNNDAFLINSIENLSGSNDLISLRSRGKSLRPFTTVLELKEQAEQQFRDKEKGLQKKLQEAEQRLASLQSEKTSGNAMILSPAQQQEIEKFKKQQIQTRKELRSVQHELGKNIERLGSLLKFINIGLVPLLIVFLGAIFALLKYRGLKVT